MLADRIRKILTARPYWGAQSVAEAVNTDARTVRVTASRAGIRFMKRAEVEAYTDALVNVIEKLEMPAHGEEIDRV